MKIKFSRHISEQYSNIKFHENPSSGRRVVQCERMDGQTHMMKITVSFRNVANEPKKTYINAEKKTSGIHPGARRSIPFLPFMTFSVSRA
jgi:hypothetical protein